MEPIEIINNYDNSSIRFKIPLGNNNYKEFKITIDNLEKSGTKSNIGFGVNSDMEVQVTQPSSSSLSGSGLWRYSNNALNYLSDYGETALNRNKTLTYENSWGIQTSAKKFNNGSTYSYRRVEGGYEHYSTSYTSETGQIIQHHYHKDEGYNGREEMLINKFSRLSNLRYDSSLGIEFHAEESKNTFVSFTDRFKIDFTVKNGQVINAVKQNLSESEMARLREEANNTLAHATSQHMKTEIEMQRNNIERKKGSAEFPTGKELNKIFGEEQMNVLNTNLDYRPKQNSKPLIER